MTKLFRNPLHIGALRNRPCICGSGKKIKQCHGKEYAIPGEEAKALSSMIVEYNNREAELQNQINSNKEGQNV